MLNVRYRFVQHLYSVLILLLLLGLSMLWSLPKALTAEKSNDSVLAASLLSSWINKSDGTVWGWGRILPDQWTNTPVQVNALNEVTTLAAAYEHRLSLKSDGTVWAWGDNAWGQLGDGTTAYRYNPVQVQGLTGVTAVAAGFYHSIALKSDGTVWAWGGNDMGQLGDSTYLTRTKPVQVLGLSRIMAIASKGDHNLALKSDGTVWAWGANGEGQLGNGTILNSNSPVQVWDLSGVTAISTGTQHSLALKSDMTVWTWGTDIINQMNGWSPAYWTTPVQIEGLSWITAIAAGSKYNLVLKSDGTIWAWGYNSSGQLGNGTTSNSTVPVQVQGLNEVTTIAAGYEHSLALKSDGTVWAWGENSESALGDGTRIDRSTPIQVHDPDNKGYLNLFHSYGVNDFVSRFYTFCLNRQPDAGGLNYWVNALTTGQQSGADVSKNFIISSEFIARNVSDSTFLDIMYNTFFNRTSDSSGKAYWQGQLDTGMSRLFILSNFVNSPEFNSVCSGYGISRGNITLTDPADIYPPVTVFVNRFYVLCLDRKADSTGLNYWVEQLTTGQSTGASLAQGFVFSPEFVAQQYSNEVFITIMYRVIFDREPDPAGEAYWVNRLYNDGTSRLEVLAGLVASSEFADLCSSIGIPVGNVTY